MTSRKLTNLGRKKGGIQSECMGRRLWGVEKELNKKQKREKNLSLKLRLSITPPDRPNLEDGEEFDRRIKSTRGTARLVAAWISLTEGNGRGKLAV